MSIWRIWVLAWLGLMALSSKAADLPLERIKLPPGFAIEVYARVPNARAMAWGERGTLFVGSMGEGKVYAVRTLADGRREVLTLASGLARPVGLAFREGALYVSAIDRILKFERIEERLDKPPEAVKLPVEFPSDRHHGWKFIAFGPDGWLYVPVGAPCNICEPDSERYANIQRISPDGARRELVARGVRNTVGFDWHPQTRELWFTDNGRDFLGDDAPPDELNHLSSKEQHFGYPYCHGANLADPEFGKKRSCREFRAPAQTLGAHVASLGMRFYNGKQFPETYRGQIFIAEHGSWNRHEKAGYRVSLVRLEGNRAVAYEPFAEGWLQGQAVWGRPADVLVAPDGALLVSDDHAGAIYRIHYGGAASLPAKP